MIERSVAAFLDGLFGEDARWSVVGGHAANGYRRESRFTMDKWIDAWELRGRFEKIVRRMRTGDD